MEALIALLGVASLVIGLIVYGSFSWGYVLYKSWYWFLIPVFPQIPHITFYQAVGLMLFIGLFKNHNDDRLKDEYKDRTKWSRTAISMCGPWLVLMCSWCIYLIIR